MAKRPAAAPAKAAAKKAKVVSAEQEALSAVTSFLKEHKRAPGVETLLAALPFAAATPKATRHAYQESFLEAVQHFLSEEESSRRAALSTAEKELGEVDAKRSGIDAQLADAEGKVKALAAASEAAVAAAKAAEDATSSVQAALDTEKATADKRVQDLHELEAEKSKYASGFAELWVPLKEGTIEAKGREKEKIFKKVALLLHDAPESLVGALQAALKDKPSERGEFANKAVQAAEDSLTAASKEIDGKISALAAEAESKKAAIAEAESKLRAAEAQAASANEASVAAQNAWADATNDVLDVKSTQQALGSGAFAKEVESAKAGLARVLEVQGKLATLRDPPAPAAEPVAEVAAQ